MQTINDETTTNTYKVKKLNKPIDWVVEVPGSKSMTNRALLMAALADGKTTLKGVLFSDDSRHFLGSLKSLGFEVDINEKDKISNKYVIDSRKYNINVLLNRICPI